MGAEGGQEGRLRTQEGGNCGKEEDSVPEVAKVTSQASPALRSFQERRRPSHHRGTREEPAEGQRQVGAG